MKRTFTVKAIWDAEAGVFVSDSDIVGLHIEAVTLDAFEAIMHDVAAKLVVANHMTAPEIASTPLKDLVPAFADPSVGLVQAPQDHRDASRSVTQVAMNREYAGFFDIGMVERNEVNAIVTHGTMCLIRREALLAAGSWSSDTIVEDTRTDFLGRGTYYFDTARMNLQSGYSTEDDYSAINVASAASTTSTRRTPRCRGARACRWTRSIRRRQATNPNPSEEDKRSISLFGGWTQVIHFAPAKRLGKYRNGKGGDPLVILREELKVTTRLVEGAYEVDYDIQQTNVSDQALVLP
ncbi:DUF1902 domain-containing protein, partial [bacterium]|nr:DUF1902 domain-containing protein [bacterium]